LSDHSDVDASKVGASEDPGIAPGPVTAWITDTAPDIEPPLRFAPIPGGHSNLTYLVTDRAGRRLVLRRPPLGHVLESAHDMAREHRIMAALAHSPVPVPPMVGLCCDRSVLGVDFYVMRFVPGHVLRSRGDVDVLEPDARHRLSRNLVDTLAAIHAVDLDRVDLADLGRHEAYISRQLNRWHRQFHEGGTRDLPLLDAVHAELSARVPEQGPATIVHGDYRLDNCLVNEDGDVAAVLDWEICTLGDPLADVGMLLVYWVEEGDELDPLGQPATTAPGFFGREQLVDRYAEVSGRDLSHIAFYRVFGLWKLACVLEGVYARYVAGAKGDPPAGVQHFADSVVALSQAAADMLETG
jgi:aminoglycoside phosphotransferase (APT) family kinase protein